MLVPAVERDGEQRARLPLEGDALALVVPHRGGAAAVEHQDHLLEQLALRRELLARRDLADVAVVGGARGVVIDVDAGAAAPRPGLQLDGAQVAHIMRADDVETFLAYPARCRASLSRSRISSPALPKRWRPWPCLAPCPPGISAQSPVIGNPDPDDRSLPSDSRDSHAFVRLHAQIDRIAGRRAQRRMRLRLQHNIADLDVEIQIVAEKILGADGARIDVFAIDGWRLGLRTIPRPRAAPRRSRPCSWLTPSPACALSSPMAERTTQLPSVDRRRRCRR